MPTKYRPIRAGIVVTQIVLIGLLGFILLQSRWRAQAAGTITVNSQADPAANDGFCTLREAIISANTDTVSGALPGECAAGSGVDTIEFAITGAADFTNGGQDGYRIKPQSALPQVTTQIVINGYTQPGAQVNTGVAPNPFNARLLIELDGADTIGSNGLEVIGADNAEIKGLVINNFNDGNAIGFLDGSGLKIHGNYIGTDPAGTIAKPNKVGVNGTHGLIHGLNAELGGLDPEQRNLISGNTAGTTACGGYPAGGWIILGNYVGLAADGVTALGNSFTDGAGGLSIDLAPDVVVGGSAPGSANVFSGNFSMGLAPDVVDNIQIKGNYFGTDYTGLVAVPNGNAGMALSNSDGVIVGGTTAAERNIFAGNPKDGLYMQNVTNADIKGNYIGVGSDGTTVLPNGQSGIGLDHVTGIVGGSAAGAGNIVANTSDSIGFGLGVSIADVSGASTVAVIGNSIRDNDGLGIALNSSALANDAGDADSGPNDYLNRPEYSNISEVGADTVVDYDLDVPDGDYRIEFFSNTNPDTSGAGEGETYLGYADVTSSGSGNQAFSKTLVGVTGITNLALTATERNVATPSGFGATSTFGSETPPVSDISVTKVLQNPAGVARGATVNYQINYTNNGPENADLSGFGNVGAGAGLIYDFVPADLINPSGYLADGPFPGSQLLDVGNPDLTCLYGPAPTAAMFDTTTDTSIGMVICWLTGADTVLEPGSSIVADLSFEVAPESDLVFTNYALGAPPETDPDAPAFYAAFGMDDPLAYLTALEEPLSNFAAARYEPPTAGTIALPPALPKVGAEFFVLAAAIAVGSAVGLGAYKKDARMSKRV